MGKNFACRYGPVMMPSESGHLPILVSFKMKEIDPCLKIRPPVPGNLFFCGELARKGVIVIVIELMDFGWQALKPQFKPAVNSTDVEVEIVNLIVKAPRILLKR